MASSTAATSTKKVLVALLLCTLGQHGPEAAGRRYRRVEDLLRNESLEQTVAQARAEVLRCGSDAACIWQFQLLEAEALIYQRQGPRAAVLLGRGLPRPTRLGALDLRRRMLLGYLQSADGHKLLEGAYQQANVSGPRELMPEMELLMGSLALYHQPEAGRAMFERARTHARELHDFYNESLALTNLGFLDLKKARYDEAIPLFEQARECALRAHAPVKAARAANNLAICYTQLGAYETALEKGQQALHEAGRNNSLRFEALGAMGRAHSFNGQPDEAIKYYRQAVNLSRQLADNNGIRIWDNNLADALCATQNWDAAEAANREELALASSPLSRAYARLNAACIAFGRQDYSGAKARYEENLSFQAADPAILWETYSGLAKVWAAQGGRSRAEYYFREALGIADRERSKLPADEYRITFLAGLIGLYQNYVEFLMQERAYDQALLVAESSRARILSGATGQGANKAETGVAQLVLAAKRSGRFFVSYWLGPRRSYVWLISGQGAKHYTLVDSRTIEKLVEDARKSVDTWDLTSGENVYARRLADAVLAPVARDIPAHAHVTIVPDGALHYVNFETLPAGAVPAHYWIEDATVAIAPSLEIAAGAPAGDGHAYSSLLIMGDSTYVSSQFPTLQFAGAEMKRVADHFAAAETRSLGRADATPEAYRQWAPRYAAIHFSAHAEANPQSPLDSAIILSPQDGKFKLYARDVIDLPLRAGLVTISACRSAGARVYSGEGLIGFAWAFLKAGAHYVVAGLWDVADDSTPGLMDDFYRGVQAGASPPDALHAAKLRMLGQDTATRKPYYWGPFQVYIR